MLKAFAFEAIQCLAVVLIAFAPTKASATPICVANTPFATLQATGGCVIGNRLYSNFYGFLDGEFQGTTPLGTAASMADVLVTATPTSITFTTDWGPNGAWTNTAIADVVVEMAMGYVISITNGATAFTGMTLEDANFGGLEAIGCLGPSNISTPFSTGQNGYLSSDIPQVCSDPLSSVYFPRSGTDELMNFSGTSSIGVAISMNQVLNGQLPFGQVLYPYIRNQFSVPEPASLPLALASCGMMLPFVTSLKRHLGKR